MSNSISGWSPVRAAGPDPSDLDASPSTPSPAAASAPREVPCLPDTDDALVRNAVRAHTRTAEITTRADGDARTPVQERIDRFRERATPLLHTPEGDVRVRIPFRMVQGYPAGPVVGTDAFAQQERRVRANAGAVVTLAARAGLGGAEIAAVTSGRGTPESIQRVAQALINDGRLPAEPKDDLPARVRIMMCDHGVGLDCAGYVQQAFLASRGLTREQTALKPALDENLAGLGSRGFARVPPSAMRPGDLMIFRGPAPGEVGHTVIVAAVRPAHAWEAEGLAMKDPAWGHPDPMHVKTIDVDSSWGNGADATRGGVRRQTFYLNEENGTWMARIGDRWSAGNSPYPGHAIEGVYR